jgi:hypothetical protein
MRDPNLDQKRLAHLHQCLHMTYLALTATPSAFNRKVKIGIAATAEAIGTALILAARLGISSELLLTLVGWSVVDGPRLRVAEMQKRRGWCSVQASLTLGKFHSLQAKIYLSRIPKTCNGQTHQDRTFESLSYVADRYLEIQLSTSSPWHLRIRQGEPSRSDRGGETWQESAIRTRIEPNCYDWPKAQVSQTVTPRNADLGARLRARHQGTRDFHNR